MQRQWMISIDRIFHALHGAWTVLRPTLCSDAPEGYLPEDLDDEGGELDTKDIMSYSWRALKEARSVLFTRTF